MRAIYAEVFASAEKACLEAIDLKLDGLTSDGWMDHAIELFDRYLHRLLGKDVFGALRKAAFSIRDTVDESLKVVPTVNAHKYLNAGERQIKTFLQTNQDLITSVGKNTVKRLGSLITENPDLHSSELRKRIQDSLGVSKRKADLWARDQTLKLHADVARSKHESLGITEYIWRTSGDERVRRDDKYGNHLALENNRYKYSDPPIVALKGLRRCNPGKDYECRCTADPILPD
jgi:SPP1 gp7 family putative phage head morphogenesis protein